MAQLFARDSIKNLHKLRQLKPGLFTSPADFNRTTFKDGALVAKTRELMAVTVELKVAEERKA